MKADGTLWAWGYNGYGQLGDGTTSQQNSPVQVGTGFASVAAGDCHTLAVKTDGTLWAWGVNAYGQLGDGTTIQQTLAGAGRDRVRVGRGRRLPHGRGEDRRDAVGVGVQR